MSNLATIYQRAQEQKLLFLVAGGHAVIAHGFPRATFDLDLIVRQDDRAEWLKFFGAMGYTIFNEGFTYLQLKEPDKDSIPVDLMYVNQTTFSKLLAEATPGPSPTTGAKVVSLHHILALKCHAVKYGHSGRVEKDVDDVLCLVNANKLDVNQPEWRELFMKHGPPELYEKLQRTGKN